MATMTTQICQVCETQFGDLAGGTRTADQLVCDRCGRGRLIGHEDLSDAHLRYIKGLGRPYAVSRMEHDRYTQETYPGEPLDRDGYEAAVEASLDPCECGGRLRYGAPRRCPSCGSTEEHWTPMPGMGVALVC